MKIIDLRRNPNGSRVVDDIFLKKFAKAYTFLKNEGFIPVGIFDKLRKELGCSKSTYYLYLKMSRAKGFIEDTYEENYKNRLNRQIIIRNTKLCHGDIGCIDEMLRSIFNGITDEVQGIKITDKKNPELKVKDIKITDEEIDALKSARSNLERFTYLLKLINKFIKA